MQCSQQSLLLYTNTNYLHNNDFIMLLLPWPPADREGKMQILLRSVCVQSRTCRMAGPVCGRLRD